MRKILVALVVMSILFGTLPAKSQAGCLFGECGPADQLIRQNQRMVNRWSGSSYREHGYGRGGYRHHNGRRGHDDVWLGLGLGAVAGALVYGALSNNDRGNQQQAQQPPPPPSSYDDDSRKYSDSSENGWNSRMRERSNSGDSWFNGRPNCRERGMFVLKNESGETIRVFQDGQPYAVIRPNRSKCGDPFAEYEAEAIVAVSDGYTARASMVRAKPEGQSGGVWVWR